jgi:hypothetical protein
METLGEKQRRFTKLVAQLITWAYANGYELTLGDAFRSAEQAKANAASGAGIANSLHCERLAIDLNLFKFGQYLSDSAAYKPLGDYWKTLGDDCAWGGDFKRPDGNHFSIRHGGRA